MRFTIITIFPDLFERVFDFGMIRKARELGLLKIDIEDLRSFAHDRHHTVDDRPFGGGDGMVMKAEPVFEAVESCLGNDRRDTHVVLLTPQGRRFDQAKAIEFSLKLRVVLICGRYEGIDHRVSEHLADEEISVGDYVLSGGELPALLIVDAVSRLIPGVVSKSGSVLEDSFMDGLLDYPHYTRPADFRALKVPEVLLSGDHSAIRRWRNQEAVRRTRLMRPDLLESKDATRRHNERERLPIKRGE